MDLMHYVIITLCYCSYDSISHAINSNYFNYIDNIHNKYRGSTCPKCIPSVVLYTEVPKCVLIHIILWAKGNVSIWMLFLLCMEIFITVYFFWAMFKYWISHFEQGEIGIHSDNIVHFDEHLQWKLDELQMCM